MLRVLYVDDEEINLELFELTFRKEFEIFKTHSPLEAISIYKENSIDVVVTDLKMPEMSGIDLIHQIRQIKPNQNCILLSGYYEPQLLQDPKINSAIFHYVTKPFRKHNLIELIESASA